MFEYSDGYTTQESGNSTGSVSFSGSYEKTDLIEISNGETGKVGHSYTETYTVKVGGSNSLGTGEFQGDCCGGSGQSGGSLDPYQNSHGEQIYTMDEFIMANSGLSRSQIINQREDRSWLISSQPGGSNMRYVRNPHDGRVIDMRHMLIVGKYPAVIGNIIETYQWLDGQASGMDRQDFYSNGVGYQFNMQYNWLQNVIDPKTFTDQLNRFFSNPPLYINR